MVPDGVPIIVEHIPQRVIIGLAGNHIPIRFDAHAVQGGGTPLDTQVLPGGIELTILRRRIPDQSLPALRSFLDGNIKNGSQFAFSQTSAHRKPVAGVDERVQADGRHADISQKIQCVRDGVNIRAQHGGVGHDIERA